MRIIGAGLSGLLAASVFPTAHVIERQTEAEYTPHSALLRFRSPAVGEAIGIPFRQVRVYKAIWSGFGFTSTVTPSVANAYAQKVSGRILPRSIWDLSPVDRFLAPPDMIPRLLEACRPRISWGCPVTADTFARFDGLPVISTIPMPVLAKMLLPSGFIEPVDWEAKFSFKAITALQLRIPDCEAYQTIYYPDSATNVYRASLTGDILIVEAIGDVLLTDDELNEVFVSFNIPINAPEMLTSTSRKFGKIAPCDEGLRRQLIVHFTQQFGIYSAGRYAIWRNILMDDLLHDLHVIRRLLVSGEYGRILHGNN